MVTSYYLKENKGPEHRKWLQSDEYRQLVADAEKETGMRYVGTYWTVTGFGEFDCEDWWEVPSWSALDKQRESKACQEYWKRGLELDCIDMSRPTPTRVVRTTEDRSRQNDHPASQEEGGVVLHPHFSIPDDGSKPIFT